ncbi:ATPase family AAA domain-containing protein 2 isoform X2 [Strongylocentrotus purpuratus]|uniref:Bromo domain-containing protein n=1 Tax=Strongylocentrotus purpuratus TaxID=7668 RepID=A0A7M7NML4_STRPU|nr:ATPase family AAA domain-containing protein 2 isoform X2 [Strongylocentrotus purpuratus]
MVKTRHGGDVDTSPGGEILSLRSRNAKRFSRSDAEDNMLSSGDDNTPRSKRQRIVSMRASGGNSEESSGYRGMTRRSYHSSGASPPTPEQRTKGKDKSSPDSTVPSNQAPSTSSKLTPKNQKEFALSRSREFRSLTKDSHVEVIEEEDDEDGIRRSRRPRKQIYSTMNQNLLTEMMLAGGANPSPEEVIVRRKKPLRPPRKEETNDDEEEEEEEDEDEDEEEEEDVENSEPGTDMYSRIKNRQIAKKLERQQEREERQRRQQEKEEEKLKRRQEKGSGDEEEESDDDSEEEDDDEEEDEEEGEEPQPQYSLRQHRQITDRYSAPMSEPMRKRQQKYEDFINPHSPLRRRHFKHKKHLTPVHSPRLKRRTHHGARDLSSTSSEGSDDERRFERRKNKSMMRARNRCLPMNLTKDDMSGGVIKDRQRIGGSLADVDPMNIDSSVTFDTVGGLGSHVQALKEMVVFPLLYPEVFERFKIAPPRGVLFHGPPGTGKTLVARALANECKQGDKRVAFFMRKGADCLSKWVGESERQLRLLFDQAFTMRPSIIFFDEIDGLAPVRSSRQDQIHSSIVSTLLALMDGLDSRGEIVVIGATNRIDAIDPALRRPGRFDREFLFPLPSVEARTTILNIHTKQWNPRLSEAFVSEVAAKCVGYCGADLKALCTEAALYALRRRYPQIYTSKEKLQLDVTEIQIGAVDFHQAMKRIVPASQRSVVSPGRSLTLHVRPLLENQFNAALDILRHVFPSALYKDNSTLQEESSDPLTDMLHNDDWEEEEGGPSIFNGPTPRMGSKKHSLSHTSNHSFLNFASTSYHRPHAHRPRFLITGQPGMGQTSHLGPALLHHMERLPVHCLDLPALYACSAKTPEESCAQVFLEARRTSPSIIYVPHIGQWWEACSATLQATFLTLLQDLPPSAPILLLATSDFPLRDAPVEMQSLFIAGHGEVMKMRLFKMDERREFFRDLVLVQATKAPHRKKKIASAALEVLPVVAPREPRELTEEEIQKLISEEEKKLRELRIFLRDVLTRLASERKFRVFTSPVDPEEVPDYVEVIKQPMDLFTMNNKINLHQYTSAKQFLGDIDLITSNALEYNPDRQPSDRMIRNRACELKDMAYAIIDAEMDSDFEKECGEIEESRSRRQENSTVTAAMAPSFYKTFHQLTLTQAQEQARELANQKLKPHQLDSSREEDGDGGTGRPKKVKKKHSKRRSAWSRGFLSKIKKKKPVVDEEEDSEEEDGEERDEEEDDEEEEREEEEGEEAMEDGEVEILHNGPLTNGDIFNHQETSNQSAETSTAPSTLSQITDDTPIATQRSPRLSHRLDNHDSDRESVKSGPCSPVSEHVIGRRSLRRNSNHAAPTHHQLQNGISSEESSEIDPPTLEKVVPFQRVKGDRSKTKEIIKVMEVENGEEEEEEEERRQYEGDTPTSAESTKGKDSNATLRRSSRRPTRSLQNDAVAMATVARNILDEPVPELVVDHDRLKRLLESVTLATTNFNIEKLERMYSVLSHHVYRHRMDYDKTELIQDMEQEVMNITVHPLD